MKVGRAHIVGLSVTLISFVLLNLVAKSNQAPKVSLKRKIKDNGKVTLFFSEQGARRPHLLWRSANARKESPWQRLKPAGRYLAPSRDHHLLHFEIETTESQQLEVKLMEDRKIGRRYESKAITLGAAPAAFADYVEQRIYGQHLPFDPLDAMREIHLRSPKGLAKGQLKEFTKYLAQWNKAVNELNEDCKLAFFHDLPQIDNDRKLPKNTGTKFFDYLKKARQRFKERVKFPFHRSKNYHQALSLPLRPRLMIGVAWLLFGREDMSSFLEQDELKMRPVSGWRRRPWLRQRSHGQFRKRALLPLLQRAIPQDLGAKARLSL